MQKYLWNVKTTCFMPIHTHTYIMCGISKLCYEFKFSPNFLLYITFNVSCVVLVLIFYEQQKFFFSAVYANKSYVCTRIVRLNSGCN